ncbi:MAG: lipid A biosynthesis acyltransferase [Gammaproteobacteria bacterium]|uniref:Lipid A biosynthesis lauroyl acyltransferase n=1 Tax=endosymbiont of Bathymodiolus septemdierum str. Myojin knoll TaxID=1303921 RepID=A0A0P0UQR9_9GAMM|nr:lipid A biosynthesis acyltransferase [Bathymodiolus septemdierum thioautotrophic gill symbiont]RUA05558.1 MAG: lipid A biosynthesis acyltransferase [Gammaproteobacteria bacterium]BAS67433.1 lipid A biosynthesis lauroyl acyltransferase [endosymbiont of Bathymodiolus septemdierum str. Myojin knoll]
MTKQNFYHPKFIPTWILIALMKLGARLPIKTQISMGKSMGRVLYRILSKFRRIALVNIAKCFPHKSKSEVEQLARQHFESLGIAFFESANCFYLADSALRKIYSISNIDILEDAIAQKKNVILLVGHFTTMMLAGRILLQNFKFADIYRPQNNALFDAEMTKQFIKHGAIMVKTKDSRSLIKTLKSGLPIWYAPDQDLGVKNSVFAPFFGVETATIKATAKLANIDNTVVIPLAFTRIELGYKLNFSPPLEVYPSADAQQNATLTNKILERQILTTPEQYLWIHRRFKSRPKGEEIFY